MRPPAPGCDPDAEVYGEWDDKYWSHEPGRGPQHMAVVRDQWQTSCACTGCPECASDLESMAQIAGWTWKPAAQWREAVCHGCDTLICEQPRIGLWHQTTAGDQRCGACLRGILTP